MRLVSKGWAGPLEVDAPFLDIGWTETKLRERDADLCRPSFRIEPRARLPNRIEREVAIVFVVGPVRVVDARPRRRDAERVRGPPVSKRVQGNKELLGIALPRPGGSRPHECPPAFPTSAPQCRGRPRYRGSEPPYRPPRRHLRRALSREIQRRRARSARRPHRGHRPTPALRERRGQRRSQPGEPKDAAWAWGAD